VSKVYVFLGPTLSATNAMAELDAVYLPPVAEGDVCRLMHRRPRVIAIVDGCWTGAPQVGHKEIMWALEQGVHVFGGAGLGALRAVELEAFGMRGVGSVFEAFRDGALEQDDEIAAAYDCHGGGYRLLSEPMINIRQTLLAGARQKVISGMTCDLLTAQAKAQFYPRRNWPDLLRAAAAQAPDPGEITALREWLAQGRVDQLAQDAATLLRTIREFLAGDPAKLEVPWKLANTALWNAARRRAVSPTAADAAQEMPLLDAVMDEIRLLGPAAFEEARCQSLVRHFASEMALREGVAADAGRRREAAYQFRAERGLLCQADVDAFLAVNDLSATEFERLADADDIVRLVCSQEEGPASASLLDDLRCRGKYAEVAGRAAAKARDLGRRGLHQTAPGHVGRRDEELLRWYFTDRLDIAVPTDLPRHARSSGFRDELALSRAVWLEFCYVNGDEVRPRSSTG
jgi:hypothetical protein